MTKRFILSAFFFTIVLCGMSLSAFCQYYYKDLVSTRQIIENYRVYRKSKVSQVKLNSFQGEAPVTEGFICEQRVNTAKNEVVTYTKTADAGETFFTATYNPQGLLIQTVDSSQEAVSISRYQYTDTLLARVSQESHARDRSSQSTETHSWFYNAAGKPVKMTRVKNKSDSASFHFVLDEKGNVIEESAGKNDARLKYYYYYDNDNKLTDVVRYNEKAGRLLPYYIFEYDENGMLATMTVVPEGSSDYQKWYYKYDENDLRMIEFCYDKTNRLLGKIEYDYTFGR
jgi:hypothetical protein